MKRICVFCGSSNGKEIYVRAARELARCLVHRHLGLVYGGAHVGCMGVVADTVLEGGGSVVGVIPRSMVDREIAHTGLSELHIVETMHQRKELMADLADGFIALPGAYGTLDEFFEILTWAQLRIHTKPIGLLNVAGFYDPLLRFLDGSVDEGFLREDNRNLFLVEADSERLVERLLTHRPIAAAKWETTGQPSPPQR